jgi:hypothetical protein
MAAATRSSARRQQGSATEGPAAVPDLANLPAEVKSMLNPNLRCTSFYADSDKVELAVEEDGKPSLSLSLKASRHSQGWRVTLKRGDLAASALSAQSLLSLLAAAPTIRKFARATSCPAEEWTGRDRPDNGHWKESYLDWDASNFHMTASQREAFLADGYSNAYLVLLCYAAALQHADDDQMALESDTDDVTV